MASALQRVLTPVLRLTSQMSRPRHQVVRKTVSTSTGAILAGPKVMRFGIPIVCVFITPFVYIGATLSKEGAAFLEENDIFVPDDDD